MWYFVVGLILVVAIAVGAVLVYRNNQKNILAAADKAKATYQDAKTKVNDVADAIKK